MGIDLPRLAEHLFYLFSVFHRFTIPYFEYSWSAQIYFLEICILFSYYYQFFQSCFQYPKTLPAA